MGPYILQNMQHTTYHEKLLQVNLSDTTSDVVYINIKQFKYKKTLTQHSQNNGSFWIWNIGHTLFRNTSIKHIYLDWMSLQKQVWQFYFCFLYTSSGWLVILGLIYSWVCSVSKGSLLKTYKCLLTTFGLGLIVD